jgi:hypothetical protein
MREAGEYDPDTIRTAWPHMLEPKSTAPSNGAPNGEQARPPVSAHVLSIRRETDACLTSWALLVAEERDLRTNLQAGDVPSVAGFLLIHADWLGDHEAGQAASDEIYRWAGKCTDVVESNRTRRYQVGRCPEVVLDDAGLELGPCVGNLWALIRQTDTMLPQHIQCDACEEHRWDPHSWPALGRRLQPLDLTRPFNRDAALRLARSVVPGA